MKNLLTSTHFYSVLGIFVVAGLNAILPQTSGVISTLIQLVLGAYAVYNHQSTAPSTAPTA